MHTAAYIYVRDNAPEKAKHVIDVGGRDINGSVRDCFADSARYVSVDPIDGRGVDEVVDFLEYKPKGKTKPDVVICCEVIEHASNWHAIIDRAHDMLAVGGTLIVTAAGPEREPHSAYDGAALRDDEYYANIDPDDLSAALSVFSEASIDVSGDDVRAVAVK